MTKIKFELGNSDKAHLIFVRKYRQQGETRYIFYRADTARTVSKQLLDWLSQNAKNAEKLELVDYSPNTFDKNEYIDLAIVHRWKDFREEAFTIGTKDLSLSEMSRHLAAYIIFVKNGNEITGLVRKITPTSVLNKSGIFTLFFSESTFNELKESKGLMLDMHADLVFKVTDQKSEGAILNKYNFNSIFDICEQQKKEAVGLMSSFELLKHHPQKSKIAAIISEDRTIQRMLINPIVKGHLNETTFDILKMYKDEIGKELAFELDTAQGRILFPTDKENEAIRDLIKCISLKFSKTIDSTHVLEGTPTKIIK